MGKHKGKQNPKNENDTKRNTPPSHSRKTIVQAILSGCQANHLSESVRFGNYVRPDHPVIETVFTKTQVRLMPNDIQGRTVGKLADTVMERIIQPR